MVRVHGDRDTFCKSFAIYHPQEHVGVGFPEAGKNSLSVLLPVTFWRTRLWRFSKLIGRADKDNHRISGALVNFLVFTIKKASRFDVRYILFF